MLNLVTGGAGFIGSHLVNALIDDGEAVIVIDNLTSGYVRNLEHAISSGRATFVYADVAMPYASLADLVAKAARRRLRSIYHLASPQVSEGLQHARWDMLEANARGTMSLVELALEHGATFLFASTSDACTTAGLDEGKRFGETAVAVARETRGLNGCVVRLFNCYGPAMHEAEDRLVSELLRAALDRRPLPIKGTGQERRSLTYVDDAVAGMRLVMSCSAQCSEPVTVGNEEMHTTLEVAHTIAQLAGVEFRPTPLPAPQSDRQGVQPDLRLAQALGYKARTTLPDGLRFTYRWLREDRLAFA